MIDREIADKAAQIGADAVAAAIAAGGGPLPLAAVARIVALATFEAIEQGALPMPAVAVRASVIEVIDEAAPPRDP